MRGSSLDKNELIKTLFKDSLVSVVDENWIVFFLSLCRAQSDSKQPIIKFLPKLGDQPHNNLTAAQVLAC